MYFVNGPFAKKKTNLQFYVRVLILLFLFLFVFVFQRTVKRFILFLVFYGCVQTANYFLHYFFLFVFTFV